MSEPKRPHRNVHNPYLLWRRTRLAVQAIAFITFLYLLIGLGSGAPAFLPHDLFFLLDPLAGIMAMVGGRQFLPLMALGFITLALSLLLGRVWCGWLCPMGTVLDWTSPGRKRKLPGQESVWRSVKYALLFAVLVSAAFGTLTLAFLDPITLIYRSLTSTVLPALDTLVTVTSSLLYQLEPLRSPVEAFDSFFRKWVVPASQPLTAANAIIGAVLLVVLCLNLVRPRFWCRYLCPLGALLGLTSATSRVRIAPSETQCTACTRCLRECPMGAIKNERGISVAISECTLCLDCTVRCRAGAMVITRNAKGSSAYDPSRRQFLMAGVIALLAGGLMRLPSLIRGERKLLVRPPGATEESLRTLCIRCGQCIRVCPTGGLQPSLIPEGLDQLWTPTLVPRVGYCDYSCNACGQTCPTGAIEPLTLEVKRRRVIGLARIDETRCIPFAENRDCIVCEEMCPVPQKAIVLDTVTVTASNGRPITVRRPRVVHRHCIGCGICEYKCPVVGQSAIVVEPSEEERPGGQMGRNGRGAGGGRGRNARNEGT